MKATFVGLLGTLLLSSVTWAGAPMTTGSHQDALQFTQDAVVDHSLHGPQDPNCPQAGVSTFEAGPKIEGGLLSAKTNLSKITGTLAREGERYKRDGNKCGVCKQNNVISAVTVTRPRDTKPTSFCENKPIELVRGEFGNQSAAEKFVKDVLDGDNQEGKRVYAACPDPCSFYVYNATTPLANGKMRVQLVVQCGQPRKGRFSTYSYSGALIHEWTCSK